jgi:hypothetical protein
MNKLDEFLRALAPQVSFSGKTETLIVPREIDPAYVIDTIIELFGSDDTLEAVEIRHGDQSHGYVIRKSIYEFAPAQSKSIGSGEHAALPGIPDYKLIELRCPTCGYNLWTIVYDEDYGPSCPQHPQQRLEFRR